MGYLIKAPLGLGLFAYRGDPPWDKDRPVNLESDFSFPAFAWGIGFTSTGAVSLIAALTNEAVPTAVSSGRRPRPEWPRPAVRAGHGG